MNVISLFFVACVQEKKLLLHDVCFERTLVP